MNKFGFVKQLMENEKFNTNQKERFFKLVSKELESRNEIDNQVLEDIRLIKEKIGFVQPKKIYEEGGFDMRFIDINGDIVIQDSKDKKSNDEFNSKVISSTKIINDTITNSGDQIMQGLGIEIEVPKHASVDDGAEILLGEIKGQKRITKSPNTNESIKVDAKNPEQFTKYYLPQKKPTTIEYKDPKHLAAFLLEYNQNPILKYTCHTIDDDDVIIDIISKSGTNEYVFEKHLELIIKEYNKLSVKYYGKVGNIHALIYTYLTGLNQKGWADDGIKVNWSTEGLKKWAITNPGKVPNPGVNIDSAGYEFVPIELISIGIDIFLFKDLVIHFKHLTHIRKDNSLRSRITRYNTIAKFSDHCDISFNTFPENIEFFTDVSKLIQAYGAIVKSSIAFAVDNDNAKAEIELNLREDSTYIYLDVHHKNSVYGTSLYSTTQSRTGESQNNLIDNQINGLCDLILKADFDSNEYAEISLWPFVNNPKKLDSFKGVQFTLKLYR
jgi:hypothetical protein